MLVGSTTSTTTAPTVASGSDQSSKVEVQPMETSKGKTIRVVRNGESPNAKKNFHHHAAVASEKTTDSLEHQQLLENRHQENISVQQSESKLEDKDKKQTSTQSQTQNEEEVDLLRNCDGGIRNGPYTEDSIVEMHCSIHPVGISTEDSGGGEVQPHHQSGRIPFVKANGFCYPDYPMNQEELKWELRSQIHPASNPVQTENSSTNHHNTCASRSSPGLPQAPLELLPRPIKPPKKRLSGASQAHDSLNEMNMLSQVNMSGLRAATDENREKSRRCLWVFLLSVCFAVMVAQITDRVRHFLSEPVSVQVTVARNNSLIYPAITICNKNKFNMTSMGIIRNFSAKHSRHHHSLFKESSKSDDIASLLGLPGIEDAHKLWNLTSHAKESMIKECWFGRNVTCDDRGKWKATLTTMGVCQTYTLNDSMVHLAGIFHNIYLKLEETQEDHYDRDNGWKFLIHDVNEIPILAVTTHGTSLYLGQGRDLRLDMKKISALHHSRNPCERNTSYLQNNCFIDCFMKRLAHENITCRLPYMSDFIDLPYCSSPDSYRLTEKVADNLLFHGQWNPNQCNCRQQCKKLLFTSSLESTTDRYSIKSGRSKARVRVYYQNLEFEYIKEDVGYGTIDLLCDVGGTLSLLMGASLLTCCELLEVAWIVMVKKCCRKVSKTLRKTTKRVKRDKTSNHHNNQEVCEISSTRLQQSKV